MAISTIGSAGLATGGVGRTNMYAGAILQVVNSVYNTQTTNSTGSYVATGVTATITPTSATSKILVMVTGGDAATTSNSSGVQTELRRNSTSLATFAVQGPIYIGSGGSYFIGTGPSINYLDSPATTSATTYATYFKPQGGAGPTATVQRDGTASTITLMEVAA